MSKDISQYLHYYLGSEIQVEYGYPDDKKIGILTGFRAAAGWEIWPHKELWVRVPKGERVIPAIVRDELVKPILLRLEDISKEDAKGLWEVVFNRKFHKNGDIRYFDKSDNTDHGKRMVLMAGVERLGIEFEGRIWADSDMILWNYKQHLVTHYLLSKGYWLFGNDWFDEGLIIDKKTLK